MFTHLFVFFFPFVNRQVRGAHALAMETALLIKDYLSQECTHPGKIIDGLREIAKELIRAQPLEFVLANVIRRVMYLVREEVKTLKASEQTTVTAKPSSGKYRYNIFFLT